MPDLQGQRAVKNVQRYYNPKGKFSGRFFEFLGGGGDHAGVANTFTAEDIVAVSMLSVDIPGAAAIQILQTGAFSDHLAQIPVGVDLGRRRS